MFESCANIFLNQIIIICIDYYLYSTIFPLSFILKFFSYKLLDFCFLSFFEYRFSFFISLMVRNYFFSFFFKFLLPLAKQNMFVTFWKNVQHLSSLLACFIFGLFLCFVYLFVFYCCCCFQWLFFLFISPN